MTKRFVSVVGLFTLVVSIATTAQLRGQRREWVVVDVAGQERVSFVPQQAPYTTGPPSVSVPVPPADTARTVYSAVEAVEFIGWREGEAVRVMVRALSPRAADGAGVERVARPEGDLYERRDIASLVVKPGEATPVATLRELGFSSVNLRIVER